MPIATLVARAHIADDIDEGMTCYLHTGDPGLDDGTQNRVAGLSATITATSGWTVHATLARASNAAALDFGSAAMAVMGISHYSLFKTNKTDPTKEDLYATGLLKRKKNVDSGATATLPIGSIEINYRPIPEVLLA